jgi:hypothetical protein
VNSQLPGIIAQIIEDIDTVSGTIDDHVCALEKLEEQYYLDQKPHEQELHRLRTQLRDMECTRRTLEEYVGGEFVKK